MSNLPERITRGNMMIKKPNYSFTDKINLKFSNIYSVIDNQVTKFYKKNSVYFFDDKKDFFQMFSARLLHVLQCFDKKERKWFASCFKEDPLYALFLIAAYTYILDNKADNLKNVDLTINMSEGDISIIRYFNQKKNRIEVTKMVICGVLV